MVEKRRIAVFDFDGTITKVDTLLDFIKFTRGNCRFYCGFFLFLPLLFLMKLHIYPNGICKQKFFSWFFRGMKYQEFVDYGKKYANRISSQLKEEVILELNHLKSLDIPIYVVTASIEEWVIPICTNIGVSKVLGTKVEVDAQGYLTGKFSSKNCYGMEKVNRLIEIEPNRNEYLLYAFGDSRGDKEMLLSADYPVLVK